MWVTWPDGAFKKKITLAGNKKGAQKVENLNQDVQLVST